MDKGQAGGQEASMQGSTIEIAVIYMASGFGKRFGGNKLLEEVKGKKLFLYGLEVFTKWAEEIQNKEIQNKEIQNKEIQNKEIQDKEVHDKDPLADKKQIRLNVILVSQYQEILEEGKKLGVLCVNNQKAEEGITASLRLGLEAVKDADFYLFSVADQPWLRRSTVESFVHTFLEEADHYSIGCLSAKKGGGGNPVIFSRRYRRELLALQGDKGGSQVMKKYPGEVFRFWAEEKEIKDVDRPSDL